jgi:hypothetical protein
MEEMNEEQRKAFNRQHKYNITRFKNLMKLYRNHIITEIGKKHPYVVVPVIIEKVDNAINVLEEGLVP